jgi:hypothetical protein
MDDCTIDAMERRYSDWFHAVERVSNVEVLFTAPLEDGVYILERSDGMPMDVLVEMVSKEAPLNTRACLHRLHEGETKAGDWGRMLYAFARHCHEIEGGKGTWFDDQWFQDHGEVKLSEPPTHDEKVIERLPFVSIRICDDCLRDIDQQNSRGEEFTFVFCSMSVGPILGDGKVYVGYWSSAQEAKEGVCSLLCQGHSICCFEKIALKQKKSD